MATGDRPRHTNSASTTAFQASQHIVMVPAAVSLVCVSYVDAYVSVGGRKKSKQVDEAQYQIH